MELPEIIIMSQQMRKEISGKRIMETEVANAKCLNVPIKRFKNSVIGKTVTSVEGRGKWLFIELDSGHRILFNPGMGADIIHFKSSEELPEKYHIKVKLEDGSGFTIRVWWFCYLHLVDPNESGLHKRTARLGLSPVDEGFTLETFKRLFRGRRGSVKNFMLNQRNIAGIGNVYIQDILFGARLHPKRDISSLGDDEVEVLYKSMRSVLQDSVKLGGLEYEKDFYGNRGGYGMNQFKIAYKKGKPCPICHTAVQKIRTGSTSSFVCVNCQRANKQGSN